VGRIQRSGAAITLLKMRTNLVFSGRIGSGKTQVSKAVASAFGLRWNSFGATIKNIAVERDLPTTRKDLQALGETLVATESEELCRRVLLEGKPSGTEPIVIDGLRHRHIRDILQQLLAPAALVVVFVNVSDVICLERLRVRDGLSLSQIQEFEEHSTEIQVASEIRALADLVADNSGTLDLTLASISEFLR
jgi:dephospho-CoA kinase